jgi:signal transduction histidine kinase
VSRAPARGRPRPGREGDRSGDLGLIRAYAILRVLVGVTICVTALFVSAEESDTRLWLILVAAAWLPGAIALLIVTWRPRGTMLLLAGPLIDLVMLATTQALLHQGIGLAACYPIIVAYAAYTCSRVPPLALGAFTLALALGVQTTLSVEQRFSLTEFGLFAVLIVGVLLIVERATNRSRGAEERVVRAQTRADVILAAVGNAVVVTDSASRIINANPAADRILATGGRIHGRSCTDVLGLHLGERRLDCTSGCQLLALASTHRNEPPAQSPSSTHTPGDVEVDFAPSDFEAWRPAKGGGRQPLLVSVNALPAADGPDVEVVHSIRDITQLKQADEAKTLFLATASHELKTPLTVINGFAKTLTTRRLTAEKQRDALAAIRRRGEELAQVVDRLLLSSRIEAGSAEVTRGPVDLIPLIYERATALGEARDRIIEVDLPDDLPSAAGDTSAIITVVDHLLDNAVKYSPDGQPVIVRAAAHLHDVSARAPGEPVGEIVIEVVDAGVGMDPQTMEHCFDKFWQADTSGTRRFGGTGIGLYIVRSLTEAMGGSVSARSTPGGGTTFAVRLDAADTGPVIPLPAPPAENTTTGDPPDPTGPSVTPAGDPPSRSRLRG